MSGNQNLLRSRIDPDQTCLTADHNAQGIQISLPTSKGRYFAILAPNCFCITQATTICVAYKGGDHKRRHFGQKKTFSPYLFVCSCLLQTLFVWLPDAWLQQQPWQRDSWQAWQAEGTAPRCRSPSPPSSSSSPCSCPPCWTPSRTRRQCRSDFTGRAPLLSRLACPQIINRTAGAGRLY